MDARDDRSGEAGRALGGDEAEHAQFRAKLDRLRQLRRRIDTGRLGPDDRALLMAVVEQAILERT